MRPSRPLWICTVAALLVACETTERWEKDGAAEALVQSDTEDCRSQARTAPHDLNLATQPSPSMSERAMDRTRDAGTQDARVFQACMQKKGYSAKR